jgi:predicted GIY-YIG superfamily endonuclease
VGKHKLGEGSLFTSKYKLTILIYAEEYDAIAREKLLKKLKKLSDIKRNNRIV